MIHFRWASTPSSKLDLLVPNLIIFMLITVGILQLYNRVQGQISSKANKKLALNIRFKVQIISSQKDGLMTTA